MNAEDRLTSLGHSGPIGDDRTSPLENLDYLRNPVGVMVRKWFSRSQLQRMLDALTKEE